MSTHSEEFLSLFDDMQGGNTAMDCSCGRQHVALGSLDEEEAKTIKERAYRSPSRYVLEETQDSISAILWDGRVYVHGCPCDSLGKMEKFLLENRELIIKYYKLHAAALTRAQQTLTTQLQDLDNQLESL